MINAIEVSGKGPILALRSIPRRDVASALYSNFLGFFYALWIFHIRGWKSGILIMMEIAIPLRICTAVLYFNGYELMFTEKIAAG